MQNIWLGLFKNLKSVKHLVGTFQELENGKTFVVELFKNLKAEKLFY
jgi:hypothetical protein